MESSERIPFLDSFIKWKKSKTKSNNSDLSQQCLICIQHMEIRINESFRISNIKYLLSRIYSEQEIVTPRKNVDL